MRDRFLPWREQILWTDRLDSGSKFAIYRFVRQRHVTAKRLRDRKETKQRRAADKRFEVD